MAVTDSGNGVGAGWGVGIQLGLIVGSEFLKIELILVLGAPTRQVRLEERRDKKSSHPLLRVFPGPAAAAQVDVVTWPGFLDRQAG